MDFDRLKHSYGVAKKVVEIGKKYKLSESELRELFVLGLNHDIGYEFTEKGLNHEKIGGEILRDSGFKYWKEVYYHSSINDKYASLYLNILNQADMQVDRYGNDIGYEKRLEDIKIRYGDNPIIYERAVKLVNRLIENNGNYQ